jgi:hypothetical protein
MVSEMNPINISSAAATERHRKSVPHYDVSPALSDLPNISFIACLHQKESHCGPVILAGLKLTVFHPPQGREERFPIARFSCSQGRRLVELLQLQTHSGGLV